MGTDLRCKHDASLLVEAARLHDAGLGRRAIAARLGVPHEAVRKWLVKYRAGGMELLLKMGGKQSRYGYGTKVAAASADALGETGKGTANFFIVIGIIETVALFTLVFSLLLLQ